MEMNVVSVSFLTPVGGNSLKMLYDTKFGCARELSIMASWIHRILIFG